MSLLKYLILTFLAAISLSASAQIADTLQGIPNRTNFTRQSLVASASLFAAAAIMRPFDSDVNNLRNDIAEAYHTNLDDILQYSPGVATLAIWAIGVEGRSKSWHELVSAMGISSILSFTLTDGLKKTAGRKRPYSEYEENSFPSGHTITAFATATMLHKEYGHKSKWYGIGGYAVASFVGISRVLNNKHWASDVLAGTGFGILSTEVGYTISDCLYKKNAKAQPVSFIGKKPSFFSVGPTYSPTGTDIDGLNSPYFRFNYKYSYGYAFEGAYFPLQYLGIGAKISTSFDMYDFDEEYFRSETNAEQATYGLFDSDYKGRESTFMPGVYTSLPICDRVLIGAKFLYGLAGSQSFNLNCMRPDLKGGMINSPVLYDEYTYGQAIETGLFSKFLIARKFALTLNSTYLRSNARFKFYDNPENSGANKHLNLTLSLDVILD